MNILFSLFAVHFICCCFFPLLYADDCATFDVIIQNATCFGSNNGAASIVVSNGTGPFTYTWLPTSQITSTAAGLPAGKYTATVYDSGANCSVSQDIQIYQPSELKISWSASKISCSGNTDGTVNVTATGGIGPYTFSLTTGEVSPSAITSYSFHNLAQVKPALPILPIFDNMLHTPPFSSWTWATNFTYLYTDVTYSGGYSIGYTPNFYDALYFHCDNCLDLQLYAGISYWVNGLQGGQVVQVYANDDNSTYGNQNIIGGDYYGSLPPNTWIHHFFNFSSLNLPLTTKLSGFRFQDLSGRSTNNMLVLDDILVIPLVLVDQNVTVTDANSCTAKSPYYIDVASAMRASVNKTSPLCFGHYGSLLPFVTNGNPPYQYLWLPTYQVSPSPQVKATISYYVEYLFDDSLHTVVDRSTSTISYANNEDVFRGNLSIKYTPSPAGVMVWYYGQNIITTNYYGIEFWVYSSTDEEQSISMALGWFNPLNKQTTSFYPFDLRTLTGLSVLPINKWVKGFYNFTNVNCVACNAIWFGTDSATQPIYLDEVRFIFANNSFYDPTRVDYYTLQITDANLCSTQVDSITVSEPPRLEVAASSSFVSCFGRGDGSYTAVSTGGTPGYQFYWTLSQSDVNPALLQTANVTGMHPSSGFVTAVDNNTCSAISDTVWILQPPQLSYSYVSQPTSCHGGGDGLVILTAEGGVPPYTLDLSNFESNYVSIEPVYIFYDDLASSFDNVTLPLSGDIQDESVVAQSGYYSMSFIPLNFDGIAFHCEGCISTTEYSAVSFWIYIDAGKASEIPPFEFGVRRGVDPEEGDPPPGSSYGFNTTRVWTKVSYNLAEEYEYNFDTFYISGSSTAYTAVRVYLDSVQLIPRWFSNRPQNTNLPAGFSSNVIGAAGEYQIVITDSNGCSITAHVNISQPPELEVELHKSDPKLRSSRDGRIEVVVIGGVGPYEYTWANNAAYGPVATSLGIGNYTVYVEDKNGCTANQTIEMSTDASLVPTSLALTVVLSIFIGVCALLACCALVVLFYKEEYYREKSPLFCKIIHFGVIIGYAGAATQLPTQTDTLCWIFPWLVGVSFTLVYGCLFLKTWRMYWIMRASQQLKKISLSNSYICRLLAIYFSVELTYLIIWMIVDIPKATLQPMINDKKQWQCYSPHYFVFWSIFISYKFVWVVFGVAMAIGSRNMIERFNESKQIYYCIYNTVIFSIICLPLVVLLIDIPYALCVVIVAYMLIIYSFDLVGLYFSIWLKILFGDSDTVPDLVPRNKPLASDAASGISGRASLGFSQFSSQLSVQSSPMRTSPLGNTSRTSPLGNTSRTVPLGSVSRASPLAERAAPLATSPVLSLDLASSVSEQSDL